MFSDIQLFSSFKHNPFIVAVEEIMFSRTSENINDATIKCNCYKPAHPSLSYIMVLKLPERNRAQMVLSQPGHVVIFIGLY